MRYLKVLALILFFFVSMVFFVQNNEILSSSLTLRFSLLEWSWRSVPIPFYVLALLAFVIGGILSMAYFLSEKIRMSRRLKACHGRILELEQELNSLRNMPLEQDKYSTESKPEDEEEAAGA